MYICIYTCKHITVYIYIHVNEKYMCVVCKCMLIRRCRWKKAACVCAYCIYHIDIVYVYIYTHTHTHIHIYIFKYICMYSMGCLSPRLPFVSVLVLSAFALGEPNVAKGEATGHPRGGIYIGFAQQLWQLWWFIGIHMVCTYIYI